MKYCIHLLIGILFSASVVAQGNFIKDSLDTYIKPLLIEMKVHMLRVHHCWLNCNSNVPHPMTRTEYSVSIAKVKESESVEENIEADTFGKILHGAMQLLYGNIQQLTSEKITELLKFS